MVSFRQLFSSNFTLNYYSLELISLEQKEEKNKTQNPSKIATSFLWFQPQNRMFYRKIRHKVCRISQECNKFSLFSTPKFLSSTRSLEFSWILDSPYHVRPRVSQTLPNCFESVVIVLLIRLSCFRETVASSIKWSSEP